MACTENLDSWGPVLAADTEPAGAGVGHQTLKPYKSCSWGTPVAVPVKPAPWACGKEGLSPPGPVSLPGAALEYSRLRILCCTDLAVLKSFSFLRALRAQGFASILKHLRMYQVNSPSLLTIQQHPNPSGGLSWGCCKEIIEDSGYRRKTFQHTLQAKCS